MNSDFGGNDGASHPHMIGQMVTVAHWRMNELIVVDDMAVYILDAGIAMRDMSCVICGLPLSGTMFMIHHLISPMQSECGNPHMVSAAVARHITCQRPADDEFTVIILDSVPCMTD